MLQVNKTRFYFGSAEDRVLFYSILKRYNCTVEKLCIDAGISRSYFYNVLNGQKAVTDKLRLFLFDKFKYDKDLLILFNIL